MDENRAIKVEDLQIGDEVIVTGIRYFKILRTPTLRKTPTTVYGRGGCKSIKCLDMYFSKFGKFKDREVYYDFNYCDIWLVKRENNN
tara:strand:+ start:615 stop:875 length:261 start_codon:yes stop_codon:yes gene_type:complete